MATAPIKGNPNARIRMLDGKRVTNCLYNGLAQGHGKYMAGMVEGKLVMGPGGRPLPYYQTGTLVRIQDATKS